MKVVTLLNLCQLFMCFCFARVNISAALYFFILGTPLGLMVISEDNGKRFTYAYVMIALLDYVKTWYVKYWFVFTIQGLTQIIIINNEIQNIA